MTSLMDSRHPIDREEQEKIDKITRARRVIFAMQHFADKPYTVIDIFAEAYSESELEWFEKGLRKFAQKALVVAKESDNGAEKKGLSKMSASINHILDQRF